MSCNCKVNKQISYIQKKYGHNIPVSKPSKIRFRTSEILKSILTYSVGILFLPIMVLHVLFVAFFKKDKRIKIDKVLKLQRV